MKFVATRTSNTTIMGVITPFCPKRVDTNISYPLMSPPMKTPLIMFTTALHALNGRSPTCCAVMHISVPPIAAIKVVKHIRTNI